jgi:hypothetical protein
MRPPSRKFYFLCTNFIQPLGVTTVSLSWQREKKVTLYKQRMIQESNGSDDDEEHILIAPSFTILVAQVK